MPLTGDAKRKYDREHKRKKRGTTTGTTEGTTNVAPSRTELEAEIISLRAEIAQLKKLLAGRPAARPAEAHAPMPQKFAGSFSRAAQAKGQIPNRSPVGRMYASQEDNW